jgi:hypothetical protein
MAIQFVESAKVTILGISAPMEAKNTNLVTYLPAAVLNLFNNSICALYLQASDIRQTPFRIVTLILL